MNAKDLKVTTIEGLAAMMVEMHNDIREEMHEQFEKIDARFEKVEHSIRGIHGELTEINRKLDRIDTRLAVLELAVFGASDGSGRTTEDSLLERISRLEQVVFKVA